MKSKARWHHDPFKVLSSFSIILAILNFGVAVLLWNSIGDQRDTDALSVSLTVLEIFLAIVALGGFFLLRSAAMRAAADEVGEVAEKLVREEMLDIDIAPIVRRAVIDYLELEKQKFNNSNANDVNMAAMMQALDEPDLEEGGQDDQ